MYADNEDKNSIDDFDCTVEETEKSTTSSKSSNFFRSDCWEEEHEAY